MRRHLDVASLPQPAEKALGLRADQRVALGMSDDGMKYRPSCSSCKAWSRDGGIEKSANSTKQIVFLVQGEALGIAADFLQIFKAEVEVAAGCQN